MDKSLFRRPALFLDRDGVINVDKGYVFRIEDFEFIEGILDLARTAQRLGMPIVVVSNQAGIGRGYYSEADFHKLMRWVRDRFTREGAPLTAVYHCPHHPEHGLGEFRRECSCRKPNPGMILKASIDLNINLEKSHLVGDQESDMLAARQAGIPHRWMLTNANCTMHSATAIITSFEEVKLEPNGPESAYEH